MNRSNYIDQLHRLFILIGGTFLVVMVLLTCANILLRLVWLPVQGTVELMGFFRRDCHGLCVGLYTDQTRTYRG